MTDKELLAIMYDFYNQHTLRDQNRDIDYYIKQIKKYSVERVLVVGAGTGRVAIPLSDYAKITAVDFDNERLEILKSKKENINVVCCDFINFKSLEKYDLIIVPYSTIQFCGDITKINKNNLMLLKIDNGYGDNIFQHKHLYHCRRKK